MSLFLEMVGNEGVALTSVTSGVSTPFAPRFLFFGSGGFISSSCDKVSGSVAGASYVGKCLDGSGHGISPIRLNRLHRCHDDINARLFKDNLIRGLTSQFNKGFGERSLFLSEV